MIRVFIVEDQAIVRAGLKAIIEGQPDMQVVAEAGDGDEAFRIAETIACDVMMVDLSIPGLSGVNLVRAVHEKRKDIALLVVSVYPESQYAVRMIRNGASGYLTKGRSSQELVEALRIVAAGKKYLPRSTGEAVVESEVDHPGQLHLKLSDRETEVFRLLAEGKTPMEVSHELEISPSTVSTHLTRIKEKLNVNTNGELIQYAYRHGLIS